MSLFRWEYVGVVVLIVMIVALYFLAKSSIRIWARMLGVPKRAKLDPNATRFIMEPDMKKEIRKGLLWLLILICMLLLLANFRVEG